nr:hypothetical protein [Tanacetum cinerariifolium]
MAHQQLVSDVHPYEMCPPNKRYDLMDANKKIDLEHVQCPPKSKILTNIIKNHPLRFSIAASSSIPWIYMAQFWHTLKEDGSKAAMGRNSLFSSSFNIFVSLSMIHEDHHWEIQRQSWTPSAPRSPTSKVDATESSVPTRSTVIRLRLPQWKSTRLTPPAPVLTVDKADELILQDTLQESPEVEITDVIVPVNVYDEEEEGDEIIDEVYELKRREKGKNVEESRIIPSPTPIRSHRIHTNFISSDTEKLQELMVPHTTPSLSSPSNKLSHINNILSLFKAKPAHFERYKIFFQELQGRYGYLFKHLRAKFMPRKSFVTLADHLYEAMADSLPTMV